MPPLPLLTMLLLLLLLRVVVVVTSPRVVVVVSVICEHGPGPRLHLLWQGRWGGQEGGAYHAPPTIIHLIITWQAGTQ